MTYVIVIGQDALQRVLAKYQETTFNNHTPVVSDTTLHLLMVIKTMLKLDSGQFDIETPFLYGELEEDLWMASPEGYEKHVKEKNNNNNNTNPHCQKVTKAIYGLVQAARQW
jgi:hypothetical protein